MNEVPIAVPAFDAIVTAGGGSRRMGRAKGAIEIGGVPMLRKAVSALWEAGATSVAVVGGDGDGLAGEDAVLVADRWPGQGPLGALVQSLQEPGLEILVVLSCDLAEPSAGEVSNLVARLAEAAADAAVVVSAGRRHWLHSAWRRSCAEALAARFEGGERSVKGAADALTVVEVEATDPRALVDIDSPDDLRRYPGAQDWPTS